MKIYIVVEYGGSYSDAYNNNLCAFRSEELAKQKCEVLNEQYVRIKKAEGMVYRYIQAEFPYTGINGMTKEELKNWGLQQQEATKQFYMSLDFLTDEEKLDLTDLTRNRFYNTDSAFNVEELELEDDDELT